MSRFTNPIVNETILRDTLLPKLISVEILVEDNERIVERGVFS